MNFEIPKRAARGNGKPKEIYQIAKLPPDYNQRDYEKLDRVRIQAQAKQKEEDFDRQKIVRIKRAFETRSQLPRKRKRIRVDEINQFQRKPVKIEEAFVATSTQINQDEEGYVKIKFKKQSNNK